MAKTTVGGYRRPLFAALRPKLMKGIFLYIEQPDPLALEVKHPMKERRFVLGAMFIWLAHTVYVIAAHGFDAALETARGSLGLCVIPVIAVLIVKYKLRPKHQGFASFYLDNRASFYRGTNFLNVPQEKTKLKAEFQDVTLTVQKATGLAKSVNEFLRKPEQLTVILFITTKWDGWDKTGEMVLAAQNIPTSATEIPLLAEARRIADFLSLELKFNVIPNEQLAAPAGNPYDPEKNTRPTT